MHKQNLQMFLKAAATASLTGALLDGEGVNPVFLTLSNGEHTCDQLKTLRFLCSRQTRPLSVMSHKESEDFLLI